MAVTASTALRWPRVQGEADAGRREARCPPGAPTPLSRGENDCSVALSQPGRASSEDPAS